MGLRNRRSGPLKESQEISTMIGHSPGFPSHSHNPIQGDCNCVLIDEVTVNRMLWDMKGKRLPLGASFISQEQNKSTALSRCT